MATSVKFLKSWDRDRPWDTVGPHTVMRYPQPMRCPVPVFRLPSQIPDTGIPDTWDLTPETGGHWPTGGSGGAHVPWPVPIPAVEFGWNRPGRYTRIQSEPFGGHMRDGRRRRYTRWGLVLWGVIAGIAGADILAGITWLVPPAHWQPVILQYRYRFFNRYRLQDVQHTLRKPPGVRRIVILGDSFTVTEGKGLAHADLFGPRLARRLSRLDPKYRYETILCAQAGWNTVREVRMYLDICRRFAPDIVIVAFVLNDIEPPVPWPKIYARHQLIYRARGDWERRLVEWSALYRWYFLRREYRRLERIWKAFMHQLYFANPRGIQRWHQAMQMLTDALRADGIPGVFIIFPYFEMPLDARYPYARIHAWVERQARRYGFYTLDLWRDAFFGQDGRQFQIAPAFDGHPNARAHARVAEILVRALHTWGLVQ